MSTGIHGQSGCAVARRFRCADLTHASRSRVDGKYVDHSRIVHHQKKSAAVVHREVLPRACERLSARGGLAGRVHSELAQRRVIHVQRIRKIANRMLDGNTLLSVCAEDLRFGQNATCAPWINGKVANSMESHATLD